MGSVHQPSPRVPAKHRGRGSCVSYPSALQGRGAAHTSLVSKFDPVQAENPAELALESRERLLARRRDGEPAVPERTYSRALPVSARERVK